MENRVKPTLDVFVGEEFHDKLLSCSLKNSEKPKRVPISEVPTAISENASTITETPLHLTLNVTLISNLAQNINQKKNRQMSTNKHEIHSDSSLEIKLKTKFRAGKIRFRSLSDNPVTTPAGNPAENDPLQPQQPKGR